MSSSSSRHSQQRVTIIVIATAEAAVIAVDVVVEVVVVAVVVVNSSCNWNHTSVVISIFICHLGGGGVKEKENCTFWHCKLELRNQKQSVR